MTTASKLDQCSDVAMVYIPLRLTILSPVEDGYGQPRPQAQLVACIC